MATANRAPKAQPKPDADAVAAVDAASDIAAETAAVDIREQRADLLSETVAAVLPMHVGHTGNNKIKLAVDNWGPWAPTMAEYIGAHAEGVQFYSGPERKRMTEPTEPGVWENVNLRDKLDRTQAEVLTWYADLDRLKAAYCHAKGCDLMGWELDSREAMFRPVLRDLDEIQRAEDPMATLRRLASPSNTSSATSADGLSSEGRRKLDSALKALLKKMKKGEKWSGALQDISDTYTREQIIASMQRITDGTDDGPKWVRSIETATKPAKAE